MIRRAVSSPPARYLLHRSLSLSPILPRRLSPHPGPRNAVPVSRRDPRPSTSTLNDYRPDVYQKPIPEYTQLPGAQNVQVEMPFDSEGVLKSTHGARLLLEQPALVITRQIEMLNLFAGFEQANRYQITNPEGVPVGFIAEEDSGLMGTITRQTFRTHRPFRSVIMDVDGNPILWVRRPFQFINSKIYVQSQDGPDSPLVGEAQQSWHPWRRKYNLFLSRFRSGAQEFDQFAEIDEGLWAWSFLVSDRASVRGSIAREFGGFGREIFTDTGRYVIRFDAVQQGVPDGRKEGEMTVLPPKADGEKGLTLDERAVMLATAISIDFDYFSRHSGQGGMGFPFLFMGGGHGADLENSPQAPQQAPSDEDAALPPGMMYPGGSSAAASAAVGGAAGWGSPNPDSAGRPPAEMDLPWWERDSPQNNGEGGFIRDEGMGQEPEEEVWGEDFGNNVGEDVDTWS